MLQLESIGRRVLERRRGALPSWTTMSELERAADALVQELHAERVSLAGSFGERVRVWLDDRIRTDELETLDRADHPEERKLAQVRYLHVQNRTIGSYERYLALLRPSLEAAWHANGGTAVRALELACGAGELTFALAESAPRMGLPVEAVGSDVVPGYVHAAEARARATRSSARFRVLNAFDLVASLRPGDVDVAFIVQSAHHFSPGKLAVMIAQVRASGARRFVAIDGRRSVLLLGVVPALGLFSFDADFIRDGFLSARRFHSELELETIARLAAPGARVRCGSVFPWTSVLVVELDDDDEGRRSA